MKYLKTFENLFDKLIPGVYVTIKPNDDDHSERYNNFLSTHIAKIEDVTGNHIYVHFIFNKKDTKEIYTEFDYVHAFKIDKVELYANTKKELRLKILANKYNL